MQRKILLLCLLIISLNFIAALNGSDFDMFCNSINLSNLEQFEIPSYVPYNNEIFDFHILEENFSGSIRIKDGKVVSIKCEEDENKTYDIYIKDLSTINDFENIGNPFELFNKKIDTEEIKIKGASFGKKFKFAITKLILKIFF